MGRLGRFLRYASGKPVLVGLFLILAAPAIFRMSRVTPPGQAPDEPAHCARAAGLLHGAVLAVRIAGVDSGSGRPAAFAAVRVNPGLTRVAFNDMTTPGQIPLTNDSEMMWLTYTQPASYVAIDNTAQYFPAAYLPGAAGLAVGLAWHCSPRRCFDFGRYGMAVAYLLLGAAAIFLAPGGESIFLAILLLPIPLFLAGTFSEDGVLIATACVSAACFAREPGLHPKSRLVALVSLTVILGAKVPYLPLAALALMPLGHARLRLRLAQMVCVIAPVLFWAGVVVALVAVPLPRAAYHPGALYPGGAGGWFYATSPAGNLESLLAHPACFVTLPVGLTAAWGKQWLREMVGVLGLMQLQFPRAFYHLWWGALVCGAVGAAFPVRGGVAGAGVGRGGSVAVFGIIVLTIWCIMIAMYLTWTDVGLSHIDGIQGRYFVLLLPFLSLAIPRGRFEIPALVPSLPALVLAAYDLHYLPVSLWRNFALMH